MWHDDEMTTNRWFQSLILVIAASIAQHSLWRRSACPPKVLDIHRTKTFSTRLLELRFLNRSAAISIRRVCLDQFAIYAVGELEEVEQAE